MALEIRELELVRGKLRIQVDFLEVRRKTVLLGRNGAGKSTLLRFVMGFIKPVRGRVFVGGKDITGIPPEDRPLSYVPQRVVKLPLTPRRQLEYFAKMHGTDYKSLVSRLGLEDLIGKRSLSVGEAQLITIATALLKRPEAVLMDEPCANLDWPNKRIVLQLVKSIDVPVLYVTHDPLEAITVATELALMEDGRISGIYPNTFRRNGEDVLERFDLYQLLKSR